LLLNGKVFARTKTDKLILYNKIWYTEYVI